jgi:hypothetical protein
MVTRNPLGATFPANAIWLSANHPLCFDPREEPHPAGQRHTLCLSIVEHETSFPIPSREFRLSGKSSLTSTRPASKGIAVILFACHFGLKSSAPTVPGTHSPDASLRFRRCDIAAGFPCKRVDSQADDLTWALMEHAINS